MEKMFWTNLERISPRQQSYDYKVCNRRGLSDQIKEHFCYVTPALKGCFTKQNSLAFQNFTRLKYMSLAIFS